MSLKKAIKLQDVLFARISLINAESQKIPAECSRTYARAIEIEGCLSWERK